MRPVFRQPEARMRDVSITGLKDRARGAWRSKGYLPPCSGGKRDTYSADVIAVTIDPASKEVQEELAETTIRLGKY